MYVPHPPTPPLSRRAGTPAFSWLCGALVLGGALAVLAAWLIGVDTHPGWGISLLPMKANAALALALLAWALMLGARTPRRLPWLRTTRLPAIAGAACIAGVTLCEHIFDWDAGIDCLLAADGATLRAPGRMMPLTAAAVLMLAAALAAPSARARWLRLALPQCLCIATAAVGMVTLLAHFYKAPGILALGSHVPMPYGGAVGALLLSLGIAALPSETGIFAAVRGSGTPARAARRVLVVVCTMLPLLAWLRLQGQAMQLYSTEFGIALVVTTFLIIMCALILSSTAAVGRAQTRIEYLNRVYSILSDINALIVRATSQAQLFEEASRIAVERGGFPRAWFGLIDADGQAVRLVAGHDGMLSSECLRRRLSLQAHDTGYGPIARAIHEGRPVVSNDVAEEEDNPCRDDLLAHGIRSYAVFPLRMDGRVIGIFKLHADAPHFFHADELRLLAELAGDIGYAIDHLEQRRKLDHLAYFDALTGLANPRLLEERLQQAIERAARHGGTPAVIALDVVGLQAVNQAFGRQAGDAALKILAVRLADACGEARCGRLGSSLFAVLVPDTLNEAALVAEFERLCASCLSDAFRIQGDTFALSARAGIALFDKDAASAKALLGHAESAVLAARSDGQRYRFYNANSNQRNAERIRLQAHLSHAVGAAEFQMHYQVKVDARTLAPCGAEALMRWHSSDLGPVSPATFIPMLEDTGLINPVGAWALAQAARDSRGPVQDRDPGLRIAVNVSPAQLQQPDFVETVEAALGAHPHLAGIDLELTESMIMTDIDASIAKLRRLRALGVRIALDDFGTGYSSMAYLARLPLDYLKIDRAFVAGLPGDPESVTVIASIIGLGHALGLKVIAEGIEQPEQASLLAALGCDQLQGYHFGRPEPLAALVERLERVPAAAA